MYNIKKSILSFFAFTVIVFSQDFDSDIVDTEQHTFSVSLFSEGYEIPWGMAFLPNRDLLVSDRS